MTIIFDCDGVLVDSEIISNAIDAELMSAAGYSITADQLIASYIGRPKREIWAAIASENGFDWPEGLLDRAETLLSERLETELLPVEGIAEALDRIEGPVGVASSSVMAKLRLSLTVTGLIDRFEPHIYSVSQVARGKPEPDIFLFAARNMGVDPKGCLVVEDSVAGVKAALAAGMDVVGFTGGRHTYPAHAANLRAAGAREIIVSSRDLPEALARRRQSGAA
ncbi:HAD family hydrolase [Pelagibacterium montanilacus]|uniref:HAD family hydrolase n=1 Tax=Pelagibacterium montanilacus TaxID=2185280 RepID=UPI001FE8451E|nr:HAD family hydrolase [Pelagibacterium montanilacus]